MCALDLRRHTFVSDWRASALLTMIRRLPRWTVHAVLALLLLVAQQRAMLHWLSHDLQRAQADSAAVAGKAAASANHACEECIAFASLASALPKAEFFMPAVRFGAIRPIVAGNTGHAAATFVAYLSRAPPAAG